MIRKCNFYVQYKQNNLNVRIAFSNHAKLISNIEFSMSMFWTRNEKLLN